MKRAITISLLKKQGIIYENEFISFFSIKKDGEYKFLKEACIECSILGL